MLKIIIYVCLAVLINGTCKAESGDNQIVTNFAKSISGVRLSISLSNEVINLGSAEIQAKIENLSSNAIGLVEFARITDFDIFVVNSAGKTFKLTPPEPLSGSRVPTILGPGEVRFWTVPVILGSEFSPGEYVLKASRKLKVHDKWFEVQSNSLRVRVE